MRWAWEDLNLRPHPQVKIPARGGKLPLGPGQPADAKAVQLDQLPGVIDLQVPLRRRLGPLRLGWRRVAGDQPIALGPSGQAVAAQDPPDPLVDSRIPPHLGLASSAAMRAGPKPGWPRAKATTRCSTSTLVWFAIRGTRRFLGRRISGP